MMAVVKCIMRIYEWVLNSCDKHHENVKSYLTSSFLFCHLISTISVPISSLYVLLFIICHLVCWYCSRFWIRQGTLEVICEQWCGLRLRTAASYENKPINAYKHTRISYMFYAFFWVIPRRLEFICRHFGTHCLFHLHRRVEVPTKMEQTVCSEMSAYKLQTPGNYPKESIKHTEHGESLKSRISYIILVNVVNFQHIHVLERGFIQNIYYKNQCSNVKCEV